MQTPSRLLAFESRPSGQYELTNVFPAPELEEFRNDIVSDTAAECLDRGPVLNKY
jgi:hypothetical protein